MQKKIYNVQRAGINSFEGIFSAVTDVTETAATTKIHQLALLYFYCCFLVEHALQNAHNCNDLKVGQLNNVYS